MTPFVVKILHSFCVYPTQCAVDSGDNELYKISPGVVIVLEIVNPALPIVSFCGEANGSFTSAMCWTTNGVGLVFNSFYDLIEDPS